MPAAPGARQKVATVAINEMRRNTVLLAGLLVALASTSVAPGQDWLGFHGLEQQGIGPENVPSMPWSGLIETNWKTVIPGMGFSSPVVVQDRIYLTTAYETNKGAKVRNVVTYSAVTLAWAALAIAVVVAIRAAGSNGAGGRQTFINSVRMFSLMSFVLLVLGICLFGSGLFDLDSSVLRSWKVGTGVTLLSLFIALLLAPFCRWSFWLFAGATALLSGAAFLSMPQREAFFDFSDSGGIISTTTVLAPAALGLTVALALSVIAPRFAKSEEVRFPNASAFARSFRIALWCGLPVLMSIGVFWVLGQRVLRTSESQGSLDPAFGWPFLVLSSVLCMFAVLAGAFFISRKSSRLPPFAACGALLSVLLALSCFLRFGCFPSQRQIAHAVVCIDRKNGKTEWVSEVAYSSTLHDFKGVNSRATPTIAASSDGLCAYFGSVGLFGLDLAGKTRWKAGNVEFDSPYGIGHSPTIADGIVVLANDNESSVRGPNLKSQIAAYALKTGHLLWRHDRNRPEAGSAGFSTPIVRTLGGRKTVLMRGWEDLTAYDLHTGEIRWSRPLKHRGNHLVAGTVTDDKHVYVQDAGRVMALNLESLMEGREATTWTVALPGEKAASPVLVDGLLFVATETGVAACLDADKGTVEWREKFGGRFFSSVVAHGNHLVFANESGDLSIVRRSRKFELVTQKNLGEKIYATPVPHGAGLLVRGMTNLYLLKPGSTG